MFDTMGNFLQRLRADTVGNTLAIVGAALVPITAMIGSGLDVSRAYMAKSRMQSACDAASLAARRVMRNDDLTDDVIATGEQFFNFNFTQGLYNTEAFAPVVSKPSVGLIRVDASTRIPTTVMKLFGFGSLPLSVSCEASLNFVNTDVVLVLDVTGSMLDSVGGTPKIDALQDAVMALYDELAPVQTQLQSQGLRLRYGIAPYSTSVNIGRQIYNVNPDYIRNSTPYQSRAATFNTLTYPANPSTSDGGAWEYYNGNSGAGQSTPHATATRSTSQCQTWVQATAVNGGGPAPTATTVTSYRGTSASATYVASSNWGWSGAPVTSGTNRSCRRWKTVTTTTYDTVRSFSGWTYRQETLDTSVFKTPTGVMTVATNAAGTVPHALGPGPYNPRQLAAVGTGAATVTAHWNGCVEERDTVSSITSGSGFNIPSGAYDLNINHIPDSDATRWRPMFPEVVHFRTAGTGNTNPALTATSTGVTGTTNPAHNWIMRMPRNDATPDPAYYACPSEARRLSEWTRTEMQTYVDGLVAIGGTYHDIGMIWGARLISTGGIFGDACEEYNSMPCNRHLIFMTDGAHTTYCNVYTAYGVERNDVRTTGGGTCPQQLARHQQRLQMICNATKNMNVSLWVIAFDTALSPELVNCATNASQASTSSNRDQLIARFRQIGNQIGALRLTR